MLLTVNIHNGHIVDFTQVHNIISNTLVDNFISTNTSDLHHAELSRIDKGENAQDI